MAEGQPRPAWSQHFAPEFIRELTAEGPFARITPEWAWGESRGKGVRVAVVDSGIEADHPAVGRAVKGGVIIEYDSRAKDYHRVRPDEKPIDVSGHGTACAGIIHSIAPEAELYSVRVLGRSMSGRAIQFAGGLDWAIENGMQVVNLSLSTSMEDFFGLFHELADQAYFKGMSVISAVNNLPEPSYPSLYSSVIGVAAHDGHDPFTYYYNATPPVEFGAPGIDVKVAWTQKQYLVATGNSFAAPHIAGITALIRANHPELTPFQVKTVLMACAANTRRRAK
ncbi:MAG TPA: S8 family serine peptidase [Anaerolineales bacterium]|nr:S8 family serine peptidase [Anaerolineales bacterium]